MALHELTKSEIAHAEYLQLLGLHLLAQRHYASIGEIEEAIAEIIGDESTHRDYATELAAESGERAVLNLLDRADISIVDVEAGS